MAAAGSLLVQLLDQEYHGISPPVEVAHNGVLAFIPKRFYKSIVKLPPAFRTPMFTYDLEADVLVNVEQSLDHLHFSHGSVVSIDLAAAYSLALLDAHTAAGTKRRMVLSSKGGVKSLKRTNMCKLIQSRFDGSLALPPTRGVVSTVLGALQFEKFSPGPLRHKATCSVVRCGRETDPVGGLCAQHAQWGLMAPIPIAVDGIVDKRFPWLAGTPWLYDLLGWPGIYFPKGLSRDHTAQRGRILSAGLFLDEIFSVMTGGNKVYGDRCAALARACLADDCTAAVLVRMVEAQTILRSAQKQPNTSGVDQMIASLAEWGYGCDRITGDGSRKFPAMRMSRFTEDPVSELTASLIVLRYPAINDPGSNGRQVVSVVAAHCVRALFTPLAGFTYRAVAGRTVDRTEFTHTVDAACLDKRPDYQHLAQLGPTENVLVENAEMLTMTMLYWIVRITAPVTFCGSLVAACGGFEAKATGRSAGFPWHLVVQGARSERSINGHLDESGSVDTADESLRRHCVPAMLARTPETDVDPLLNVSVSLHNNVPPDPAAERTVYRGFTATQATARFNRRSGQLVSMVINQLPTWEI